MGIATPALGQSLFLESALDDQLAENPVRLENEIRARQVYLDKSEADKSFGYLLSKTELQLDLFPGRSVKLTRIDYDPFLGGGARNWIGKVEGFENGLATLVYDRGNVIGHIQIDDETYAINPGKDGVHVISQLDLSNLPPEHEPVRIAELPKESEIKQSPVTKSLTGFSPRIRVLVIWTPNAEIQATSGGGVPRNGSLLAIALANTALANSQARGQRFKFAGHRSAYCNYNEHVKSYPQILLEFRQNTTCVGARAAQYRDATSADMVSIIRATGGGCGIAVYAPYAGNPNSAFSLTARNCVQGHTFTHELGHNIGLDHDRYVATSGGDQSRYNYGQILPGEATPLRTIMAYNNGCQAVGKNCIRVPVFSNKHPMGDWNGVTMGRGQHQSNPALARKTIVDNWDIIAGYR